MDWNSWLLPTLHTDVSLPPCEGTHQGKLNSTLPSSITLPGNCEAFFVPYAERQASLQILVSRSLTSQQYNSWSSATKSSSQLTLYLRCHYGTCLCSSMLSGKRGCSVGLSKTCQEERIEDLSSGFPLPRISLSPTSTPKSHLTAKVGRREWGSALRFLFSLFTTAYTLMVSVLSSGTTWFFIFCYSPWSQKAWHSIPGVLCSLRPWDSEKKSSLSSDPHWTPNCMLVLAWALTLSHTLSSLLGKFTGYLGSLSAWGATLNLLSQDPLRMLVGDSGEQITAGISFWISSHL